MGANIVRHEHLDGLADKLFARVAEQFLALRIDQTNGALGIDNHQTVGRQLQNAAEKPLRLAQALFGALALRDVTEADDRSDQRAVFPDRGGAILDRQPGAVFAPQEFVVNAARLAALVGGQHRTFLNRVVAAIGTVVMNELVRLLADHFLHSKAQQLAGGCVDEADAPFSVDTEDTFGCRVEDEPGAFFADRQLFALGGQLLLLGEQFLLLGHQFLGLFLELAGLFLRLSQQFLRAEVALQDFQTHRHRG